MRCGSALLETAARHNPEGAVLRFLEPSWRRGDANVRGRYTANPVLQSM